MMKDEDWFLIGRGDFPRLGLPCWHMASRYNPETKCMELKTVLHHPSENCEITKDELDSWRVGLTDV